MNITDLHESDKGVSAIPIFKSDLGNAISIQLLEGEILKEHITKTPALLICLSGNALFENEQDQKVNLLSGDYVQIEAMVKHWVIGVEKSQLVLVK